MTYPSHPSALSPNTRSLQITLSCPFFSTLALCSAEVSSHSNSTINTFTTYCFRHSTRAFHAFPKGVPMSHVNSMPLPPFTMQLAQFDMSNSRIRSSIYCAHHTLLSLPTSSPMPDSYPFSSIYPTPCTPASASSNGSFDTIPPVPAPLHSV
jgi:hypothetical protein